MEFTLCPIGTPGALQGAQAFHQHQEPNSAEKHHIREPNHEIDLTDIAQFPEQPNAERRPYDTADQQHAAHLEINIAASPMRDDAGD